ncbi:MAG: M13 family peptidase, partial [Sphingomonas sp.]
MKIKTFVRTSSACLALMVASAATAQTAPHARYGAFGLDLTSQDKAVKPGDDFWTYANGTWAAKTAIPADKGSIGYGNLLNDEAEANVRKILDDMAANPAQYGATGKQVGDFYASWMDTAGIEAKGAAPLKPYLARIDAVKNLDDLQTLFATTGYAAPVGVGIIPSLSDPTHYTAIAGQGGLGMARDNYLLEGAKYDGFRKAYRAYI